MTIAHVALFAWFPIVLVLFARLPKHRALIVACIAGVLFLPEIHMKPNAPGEPEAILAVVVKLTKANVVALAPLLGVFFFDRQKLLSFRPRWFDVPMLAWCLAPGLSAIVNDTSLYDSVAAARDQTLVWGTLYFLGRCYFTDQEHFRELAIGIVLGGLAYVPFCMFEVVMSPQLHKIVYGYYQHDFVQTMRGGGFRPMVFMEHGLAVGTWMVAATLVAAWLWWTGALPRLRLPGGFSLSMLFPTILLLGTCVACKSTGALSLGLLGGAVLVQARWWSWPIAMAVLLAIAPLYIVGRTWSGREPIGWLDTNWSDEKEQEEMERRTLDKPLFGWSNYKSQDFIDLLTSIFSRDRSASMAFRLINEDMLMENAWKRPMLGWGGWGKSRLIDPDGYDHCVTDGLWIIVFGENGFFGVAALFGIFLMPAGWFAWKYAQNLWGHPAFAPAAVTGIVLVLYMIDCLSNAMVNPVFSMVAGGTTGLVGAGIRIGAPGAPQPVRVAMPVTRTPPERRPENLRPGVLVRRPPAR